MERKIVHLDENTVAELHGDSVMIHQNDLISGDKQTTIFLSLADLRKIVDEAV